MANVAETLRARARLCADSAIVLDRMHANAPLGGYDATAVERRIESIACESGARSWEIVQRIGSIADPCAVLSDRCQFCNVDSQLIRRDAKWHSANCLWQQARSLVTGQEER